MPKIVKIINKYSYSAKQLWSIVIDYAYLHEVMEGKVKFTGVPDGITTTGQKMHVKTSLFGKLPEQDYYMEVLECNHGRMTLRSSEKGAGVKSWRHTLTVREDGTGCVLQDEIEIDAGIFTALFCMWAKYMYQGRHEPRLKILKRLHG